MPKVVSNTNVSHGEQRGYNDIHNSMHLMLSQYPSLQPGTLTQSELTRHNQPIDMSAKFNSGQQDRRDGTWQNNASPLHR